MLGLFAAVLAVGIFGGVVIGLGVRNAAPSGVMAGQIEAQKAANRARSKARAELRRGDAQRAALEERLKQAKREEPALQEKLNALIGNSRVDGGLK